MYKKIEKNSYLVNFFGKKPKQAYQKKAIKQIRKINKSKWKSTNKIKKARMITLKMNR